MLGLRRFLFLLGALDRQVVLGLRRFLFFFGALDGQVVLGCHLVLLGRRSLGGGRCRLGRRGAVAQDRVGHRISVRFVRIAGRANAHAAAATHGPLLHDVGQLMGHQAAIRWTGVTAQEDVAAGGKGVGRETPIQHVGLGIVVDAYVLE